MMIYRTVACLFLTLFYILVFNVSNNIKSRKICINWRDKNIVRNNYKNKKK